MAALTDWDVTETMIRHGGSFVRQLGQLFRQADVDNQQRLKTAFPEYWKKYSEIAHVRGERLHATENTGQ
jgi:hypothetical protein